MLDVAWISILHDPSGVLTEHLRRHLHSLSRLYSGLYVVATHATHEDSIEELVGQGCVVELQKGGGVGLEFAGDARRQALRLSVRNGHRHSHFVDLDRIIRWEEKYPDELREVVKLIPKFDFLVIGRTERAYNTHPRTQMETEKLANKVCSLIVGREIDITAASRGISKEAAEIILKHSKAKYFETDSEWPIIIHCKSQMPIEYVRVDGLEYEDWMRHREEVERVGGLEEWKREIDENPARWMHRIRFAKGIAETAISTYNALTA